jgi:hypothetical protein
VECNAAKDRAKSPTAKAQKGQWLGAIAGMPKRSAFDFYF